MANFIALFVDLGMFIMMPILGGITMTSVEYNFDKDPITFSNADLSKLDLYSSQMKLVKDGLFSVIGRPDFYSEGPEYQPP